MIRRVLELRGAEPGLVGHAAPLAVFGSIRITVPSRVTGSPAVRRSWLRSAPPWFAGSPHDGLPVCPESTAKKSAPSPALAYSAPPWNSRLPRVWLGYCWHQSSISTLS